jgi:hypothetical protein
MCSTNIHARTQMQLPNSGRVQRTYIEQRTLFNQIRQGQSKAKLDHHTKYET